MSTEHQVENKDSHNNPNNFNALRNHIIQGIKTLPIHRLRLKGDMLTKHPIKRNRYIKGQILEHTIRYILHFLGVFERNTTIGLGADFWNDKCLIEAKHWEKRYSRGYSLTSARFLSEVLARFLDSDPNHRKIWILITSAGINEETLKLLQAHKIQAIIIKVITDDQTLEQTNQIILQQLRRVLHIQAVRGAVRGAFGEVGDVVAVDVFYESFVNDTCAPLMRGFCPQNPDLLIVNPQVEDPYHIRWNNQMVALYMLETEAFRSSSKEWRRRGLIKS